MKRFPFPFRFSIPLTLVFFGSSLGLFFYLSEISQSKARVEETFMQEAAFYGSSLSALMEYHYREGNPEENAVLVSQLGAAPFHHLSLLLDENDAVIYSTRNELKTKNIKDVPVLVAGSVIDEVRGSLAGKVRLSEDRKKVIAIYPVVMGAGNGKLRPERIGMFIIQCDLDSPKRAIYADAVRRSIPFSLILIFLTFVIWVYLHRTLTSRINMLVETTNKLSDGNLSVRNELQGTDELVELSDAFNKMADKIQADTGALKKSRERFDLAVRGANDGLWDRDLITNEVYYSPRWKSMIGYEDHEIPNHYDEWIKRIHPDDKNRVMDAVKRHIDGLTPYYQCEYRLMHKYGTYRWILSRGLAVRDADGKALRMAGSHTDITERKKTEDDNLVLHAQMFYAQKLKSLGVLAGGIAHDFNNLLTSIMGNTELALKELQEDSPVREHIYRVEEIAHRAAELTKQMLAYSGKGRFVIENTDLSELVKNMTELLKVSIGKKAVMKCDLPEGLPQVEADATQIRQVVMNLMINASDAIGDKAGTVTVTTGTMECDREYLNDADIGKEAPEGAYVYIDVSDTGCGMDEETKAKIFDPFFTTKLTGRGLGLAAVYGIVRGHKGVLKVNSRVGEGTTFRILFPRAAQQVEIGRTASKRVVEWQGGGTLLLVDDDEDIIFISKMMLEKNGFTVMTATDGRKGVELFCEHSNEITAVLLDLSMPNMGGEEAFREMKKCRADARVILTSGYDDKEIATRCTDEGFAAFLQKPYTLPDLMDKVQEVLAINRPPL